MKMIGKYSVASALRWLLGFVNVFVMIGAIATILVFLFTLIVPSFGAGLIDGLKGASADPSNTLQWTGRLTFLGAAMACGFTSFSHFSRVFRQAYAVPPSALLKPRRSSVH